MTQDNLTIWMPKCFPSEAFENYKQEGIRLLMTASGEHWAEFSSACSNTSWRFRACWDHAESYKSCYQKLGPIEAVFETEKHYFGTYVNGMSAVESMMYSIHALLTSSVVLGWPFDEPQRKKLLPYYLLDKMRDEKEARVKLEALETALRELRDSDYWEACKQRRNRMYHRTRIPRHLAIGGGPPRFHLPATSNTEKDSADLASIEKIVDWVAMQIESLTVAANKTLSCFTGELENRHE